MMEGLGEEVFGGEEGQKKYQGSYQNNMKNGLGKLEWGDGKIYVGGWVDNKMEGEGCCRWPDGKIYYGQWLNGLKHGKGCYKWDDGRMYYGEYDSDQKHGEGVYRWADGRLYIGGWIHGKQADMRTYILPNGDIKKAQWQDNKKGPYIEVNKLTLCLFLVYRWTKRKRISVFRRELKLFKQKKSWRISSGGSR